MPAAYCNPCRRLRNLCDRKRRRGVPTNLRYSPCASCRAAESAARSARGPRPRPSQARPIDEQMVYRLLGGPEPDATRAERREAIRQLLAVRPKLQRRVIAERVGVHLKTVERVAAAVESEACQLV